MLSAVAAPGRLTSGARYIVLNGGDCIPDRTTTVVVSASNAAAAGVIAVLREAGLLQAGPPGAAGGERTAVYVADARRVRARALRRVPAPRLIVISHDPVALIEELAGTADPTSGVTRARERIGLVLDVALRSKHPVLLLSHSFAVGSLAELIAVVRTFCGLEAARDALSPPDSAKPLVPSARPRGIVTLRPGLPSGAVAPRTIVIGGPPRSGTSMIAAVLHAAGLPLGDALVPSTFESALQNILFKPSGQESWKRLLNGSWRAAVAHPRHVKLAWRGFDVTAIKAYVASRRQDGPIWGFKRPGIGHFIRLGGFRLLDGPRLIMSLRDPVAAAARINQAHDVEWKVALRIARWFLLDSLETARVCTAPTLLVSHDAAKADLPRLFGWLLSFCGVEVDATRYDEMAASVERAGTTYRKDFAEPFIGELIDIVDDDLYGWVEGQQQAQALIDVLADNRRIASIVADEVIDDVGRLFFKVRLPAAEVASTTRIRAVVVSSQAELRNSGLTIGELRRD